MTEIRLHIRNRQSDGAQQEQTDTVCRGIRTDDADQFHLEYDLESDPENGGTPMHCRITVKRDQVEIRNSGPVESCLIFRENTIKEASYITPFGSLSMEVRTKRVRIRDNPKAKSTGIQLKYSLYEGGSLLTENDVQIEAYP